MIQHHAAEALKHLNRYAFHVLTSNLPFPAFAGHSNNRSF